MERARERRHRTANGEGADDRGASAARRLAINPLARYLPTDELLFLMELSIEPVANQLGLPSALGR
jgi:hypothetical protein